MRALAKVLFPLLLAIPLSGSAQGGTQIILPGPLGKAVRALPADSGAAYCILTDTLSLLTPDTVRYEILTAYRYDRPVLPRCAGSSGVLLVRPPCVLSADEVAPVANATEWATTVLLCGPREKDTNRPTQTYIWRQLKQAPKGKIA